MTHLILRDPDCVVGKHQNCNGQGWDVTNDQPADCPCECHEEAK